MPTTTPAVVRASALRNFLTVALDGDLDVHCRYTVSSIGIYNETTGALTECDMTAFYDMVGADIGEEIAIGASALKISRYVVVHNDDHA